MVGKLTITATKESVSYFRSAIDIVFQGFLSSKVSCLRRQTQESVQEQMDAAV